MPAFTDRASLLNLQVRGWRRRHVETRSGRVHLVEAEGDGALPPVVLLHGFTAAGAHYGPLLERLRRTSRHVLAPDLPAHGFSDSPVELGLDALYLGLRDALDQCLDGPSMLVGNSLGGALAVRYAIDRPQRVLGLALLSPGGAPMSTPELAALKALFDVRSDADALAFVDRVMVRPGAMRRLYAYGIRGGFARPAIRSILAAMTTADCLHPEELRSLAMPVRVMWGEHERVLPPSGRAFFEANLPAQGRVELHRDIGHCPHLDDLDHTTRTLVRWGREFTPGAHTPTHRHR
ncbi:MAG: alpha/beta fold hydrolase [Deltaproteobacteria bacterium]|nr:alpha/beta fold hydrolase [Myxococcales bacterium]MDP3215181.1 alpha/beta fold hydrolase [Deltaproteobacteria bacterium]